MGLIEWTNNCNNVIMDEHYDWLQMREKINKYKEVMLMPAITCDTWPIYVFNDLKYGERILGTSTQVYVVPLGSHRFYIQREIEQLLNMFYDDREIPDSPNYNYGYSLEEVILLDCCEGKRHLTIDGNRANGFAAEIYAESENLVYIIGVMETAEEFWKNIILQYEIPVKCLVDSNKGLGDWFTAVPLYKSMSETENRKLLPRYYFKGKYISTTAPEGFEWIADIKESPEHTCLSQLYKTGW